jgi:oligoribonuclease
MPAKPNLCWLDFETTGFTELDKKAVYDHKILEIGMVVTDSDFKRVASLQMVIHHDVDALMPLCDDVVKAMHIKNGLFKEVGESTLTLAEAEKLAIKFLEENKVGSQQSPLTGNGVHFDRTFMEVHMPALNSYLTYRLLDISAVKEFIKVIAPGLEPKKKRAHRAMDDIDESIKEAVHYRKLIEPALQAALRNLQESDLTL